MNHFRNTVRTLALTALLVGVVFGVTQPKPSSYESSTGPNPAIFVPQTPSQPAATPTSQPVTSQSSSYVAPKYTVPSIDFSQNLPSTYVAPPSFDNAAVTPTPAYHVTTPTQTWQTKPTDNCIGASAVGC